MTEPRWPHRRTDVINALDRIATIADDNLAGSPNLTDAVHWLVDDTDWDQHSPAEDVGTLLRNQAEAAAISEVLAPLLTVLDDLGPHRPDEDYLRHTSWHGVADRAARARNLLIG